MEKFNPKRTTDDTYTPPAVVVAVEKWVRDRVPEIATPIYSPQQMEVLRTGFSRGHTFEQVATYADPALSTDEMTRRCDEFPIVPRGIKVYRIGEYRRRGGYFPPLAFRYASRRQGCTLPTHHYIKSLEASKALQIKQ